MAPISSKNLRPEYQGPKLEPDAALTLDFARRPQRWEDPWYVQWYVVSPIKNPTILEIPV
jgi:hypothetical protein